MRSLFVVVALALAEVPIVVRAQDEPAVARTTPSDTAASVVLTTQGIQRQAATQPSNLTVAKTNVAQLPLLSARLNLMDVVRSLACTSMFARRPETQGTDPAASAGR